MKSINFRLLFFFKLYYLIDICSAQLIVGQSDRVFIKLQNFVYASTPISGGSYKDYTVDLSSAKFQQRPQIIYALDVYNTVNCTNQGFNITTLTQTASTLTYRLASLGCELDQLHFTVLAIDDPYIEVQSFILNSLISTTIVGKSKIMQIAGFISGFKGISGTNIVLKYTLTKINDAQYQITFINTNVSDVYMSFVIVYQQDTTNMFSQLYSSETAADTNGQALPDNTNIVWKTTTNIDQSQVLFGLKDFDIEQKDGFLGLKLLSAQTPTGLNKSIQLNYFTWNGMKVNMMNGVYMAFKLNTCTPNQYMYITSITYSCTSTCNTVDHHYNNNPLVKQQLYSSQLLICQQCDANCFGCQDDQGLFFNPTTNSCSSTKPAGMVCTSKSVSGQTYNDCQLCHPTCKECSQPNSPTCCTSCRDGFYQFKK